MTDTLLTAIGSDRHLALGELEEAARPDAAEAWSVYRRHFACFTGARVDEQFGSLDHPAVCMGAPRVSPGTTVVLAGTGPSLVGLAAELRARRGSISLWTSPRGAEALLALGLAPDLVLVQHRTALDAYMSARHPGDRNGDNVLDQVPVVLAEPGTPAQLLANVPRARLATFDPATGWGWWPASLAALALEAGPSTVALAGFDLGTAQAPDPAFDGLRALLALLARDSRVATVDIGGGTMKDGWPRAALAVVAGRTADTAVALERVPRPTPQVRREQLAHAVDRLSAMLAEAARLHTLATGARDGRGVLDGAVTDGWRTLHAWRDDIKVRIDLQEHLGTRLLPTLWRLDTPPTRGPIWRPILLATDELLRQASAARRRLAIRAAA